MTKELTNRIEAEAEAAGGKQLDLILKDKEADKGFALIFCQGYAEGYTAAATKILENPGEYGLAGSWVRASEQRPPSWYNKTLRFIHTKAIVCAPDIFLPNQTDLFDQIEWLDESASPTPPGVEPLVEALKMVQEKCHSLGIPYYAYGDNEAACAMAELINELASIATEALKQYK